VIRKHVALSVLIVLVGLLDRGAGAADKVQQRLVPLPKEMPMVWPSKPPDDCPFKQSRELTGVLLTGRYANYTKADGWYPSWAADGNLYSAWSDGSIKGVHCSSWGGAKARTAQAKVSGDDPMKLEVVSLGVSPIDARPYQGRYPCGSLVHKGIWYYGTYCLQNRTKGFTWDVMGPFVGWRYSTDFGKTWHETKLTPGKPLFPEPKKFAGPIRFGSPVFVDFGRDMQHSPDGKAYIVAQGAVESDPTPRVGNCSWINGDQIYMARVLPSTKTINDESKYEYFAGHDKAGEALWTDEFEKVKPLIDWNNHCGFVTMTYDTPLKKYLTVITDGRRGNHCKYDTYILESDKMTGPYKLVSYMREFGQQAYFVHVLSKFLSSDGRTAWILYCANWFDKNHKKWRSFPPGSEYCFSLHEIRMLKPGEKVKGNRKHSNPLTSGVNVALNAKATASSSRKGFTPAGAIDGNVGGYPGKWSQEWASNNESKGAWLKLTWARPQKIDRVLLFDRPNKYDYITAGRLEFSDGSKLTVGELTDDATSGREIRFPVREVKWLKFTVTGVKTGYPHIGLSEIAVFEVK